MSLKPRAFARSLRAFTFGALTTFVTFAAFAPHANAATRHARSHKAGPSYPMKADEYRALMEKKIDGVRAVIDRKLDRRGVSAERKKAIHKILDDASKDLRAEIARAAADGTVTQAEADKVKPLANGLRAKVRERMRAEKSPSKGDQRDQRDQRDKADEHAKAEHGKGAHEKAPQEKPEHGKSGPAKVAKADAAKSGTTKATKSSGDKHADAKKKAAGPTKHADATKAKAKPEATSGESDL